MTAPKQQYDVIVVGGGINGLAVAAYLQKAGLQTAVFERRDESGTFCSTEEVLYPGVKLNMHASLLLTHYGQAYVDLELERFGLELLRPPGAKYAYFHPFLDGNALLFSGGDARETYEAWRRISPNDAETFRKIANVFGPLMAFMERGGGLAGRQTDESFLAFLEANANVPFLPKDWIWMTGVEFADCLFENEQVKLGLLSYAATGGLDGISSRIAGPIAVLTFLTRFTAEGGYTARGGSHDLTHSLVRCFVHYGGKIFYNCPVEKAVIENNEVKGVVLSKSATYPEAEFKASQGGDQRPQRQAHLLRPDRRRASARLGQGRPEAVRLSRLQPVHQLLRDGRAAELRGLGEVPGGEQHLRLQLRGRDPGRRLEADRRLHGQGRASRSAGRLGRRPSTTASPTRPRRRRGSTPS